MRAAALSRLITLMLMVGPAAFAAPLNAPVGAPAPANAVGDTQRADVPTPNVGDAPVSTVAENRTLPEEEVETNRDAVHMDQQGVSATPKVLGTHPPTSPVSICLIVVGRTPGEVIQTPGGPKYANANGEVFGDCQPVEDPDSTFAPGFINLADSDPSEGNGDDTDDGSGNDVSTADEPPASNDSTSSPSDGPSSSDTAPTSDGAQGSGDDAPSTDGQDASPASGDGQDQTPPADDEQPAGNQHATQPGDDSFPDGAFEEGVSRLAQMTPNGIPPNGIPPNGIPPNGIPPNGMPPNEIPPNGVPPSGFPSSAEEGAASRASQVFPNGDPSAEQLSSFSPLSPSGNIHAPSTPSYTDAPFDSSAPPAGAIQAAQDVSPDAVSAPADAGPMPFGYMNLADSPKPEISVNAEARPLGDDDC